MSENTVPAWYEGATPWETLSPALRLWEAVNADGLLAERVEGAGFRLHQPADRCAVAVDVVMSFAGRAADEAEIEAAAAWLVEGCYLLDLGTAGPSEAEQREAVAAFENFVCNIEDNRADAAAAGIGAERDDEDVWAWYVARYGVPSLGLSLGELHDLGLRIGAL